MSRERARRRAERQAAAAARTREAERAEQRRNRWRALRRRLTPRRRRVRRVGPRRSRAQLATMVLAVAAVEALVWYYVPVTSIRVAAVMLAVIAVPVFMVLSFDRVGS